MPAHIDEEGVEPAHRTETFAEINLELDNWRWAGTDFRLRTGKALRRDRNEIAVHFRPVPHIPFLDRDRSGPTCSDSPGARKRHAGAHRPWRTAGYPRAAGPHRVPRAGRAARVRAPPSRRAQQQLPLPIRADEAEEVWKVVTPILDAWATDVVPLHDYAAGSDGPPHT
ncbi:hypothetical protein AB0J74_38155 [Asanoa sp. NPDC049573]|uniref:hypothetical protein n=1 Tax=Asanoa sp. NPDC049573 TaxID=3155396 RepID=UPI00344AB597